MLNINEKEIDRFIKLSKDGGVVYKSRAEASEAAHRLFDVYDLLFQEAMKEMKREGKLKDHPKGFALESNGRMCSLCSSSVTGDIWYDKWGMKCMACHEAFKKKIVPGYVFRDDDNEKHITASQLQWEFDIRHQTIKKLIRQGRLKVRTVKGNGTIVFLKSENPDLIKIIEKDREQREAKT